MTYLNGMGMLICGDSSSTHKKLVNTYQSNDITTWDILNGLYIPTHQEHHPA